MYWVDVKNKGVYHFVVHQERFPHDFISFFMYPTYAVLLLGFYLTILEHGYDLSHLN